ncbi:hypothetical protein SAMN05443244_3894 [Terriglobus roseus]|uniref:Uncharacterized protein n=1 Tax=Terriglobus roseus TaxID=392734 RepID=A0A1H4TXQ1_9BACT|nr:hypothetical protein SAMN05443244_3894 [Terriglobus roseus]
MSVLWVSQIKTDLSMTSAIATRVEELLYGLKIREELHLGTKKATSRSPISQL